MKVIEQSILGSQSPVKLQRAPIIQTLSVPLSDFLCQTPRCAPDCFLKLILKFHLTPVLCPYQEMQLEVHISLDHWFLGVQVQATGFDIVFSRAPLIWGLRLQKVSHPLHLYLSFPQEQTVPFHPLDHNAAYRGH